jgi:hypothetical protein
MMLWDEVGGALAEVSQADAGQEVIILQLGFDGGAAGIANRRKIAVKMAVCVGAILTPARIAHRIKTGIEFAAVGAGALSFSFAHLTPPQWNNEKDGYLHQK